jgi:hypothetical protein
MRTATAKNAASSLRKSGLYPCNSHIFGQQEFLVAATDCEHASVETPRRTSTGTSRNQVNNTSLTAIDIFHLHTFCEIDQTTRSCAGLVCVITNFPYKNLVERARKKFLVNKKKFQSRAQEKTGMGLELDTN